MAATEGLLKTGGHPRNPRREKRILELLGSGLSVIKVARLVGVHRNTVYFTRDKFAGHAAMAFCEATIRELEELELRHAEIAKQKEAKEQELKRQRYSAAIGYINGQIDDLKTSIESLAVSERRRAALLLNLAKLNKQLSELESACQKQ